MARQKLLKMKPNLPMREKKNMRTEKETFEEEIAKGEKKSLLMQKNRLRR